MYTLKAIMSVGMSFWEDNWCRGEKANFISIMCSLHWPQTDLYSGGTLHHTLETIMFSAYGSLLEFLKLPQLNCQLNCQLLMQTLMIQDFALSFSLATFIKPTASEF